ncbi:MAG TPA: hypothetical protein VLK37_11510 [Solirubrobacterales bacterium]|nr:hypothetical protein [Solirubrobacterales bacterium]
MHRRTIAITLLLAASLFAAATAPAAEAPTRDEYVERLEKLCKPDAEATQRAMKGARGDIKAERFDAAAKKFAKATAIFGGDVKKISAVPRPSTDTAKLRKWFTYLNRQEDYLGQITAQLRQDHPTKALRLIQRFIHSGNLANNVVLAFGFNWCSFEFSRYG